jgi:rubrerythrin
MSVKGAVLLALDHEKEAHTGSTAASPIKQATAKSGGLARQFADEELQHVAWLEEWRDKCGPDDEKRSTTPIPR